MRRWMIMLAALLAVSMLPSQGTELSRLRPAAVLALWEDGKQITLETDMGDLGEGETLEDALRDLRDSAPGEVLLDTVEKLNYKRSILVFQPHTYSRTQALFDDFVRELKLADVAILAEIYAAREINDIGISSSQLAAEIPGAIYCSTLDQVADTLAQIARPDDLILTVGAGDIFRAGEKLLEKEKNA